MSNAGDHMIKKMFFIVNIVSISVVLHAMKIPHKKIEESKSKKSASKKSFQELGSSSEDNEQSNQINSTAIISSPKGSALSKNGKASVKSLNDLKDVRRAQNEFREKAYSKSDSVSGKK